VDGSTVARRHPDFGVPHKGRRADELEDALVVGGGGSADASSPPQAQDVARRLAAGRLPSVGPEARVIGARPQAFAPASPVLQLAVGVSGSHRSPSAAGDAGGHRPWAPPRRRNAHNLVLFRS
jgi:hypothetical protein